MKITSIVFTHSSYKTTNPPVSTFRETLLCERPEGGFMLKVSDEYNSAKSVREYSVTDEQFSEIVSLFEQLGVSEAVSRFNANINAFPFPQMAGGSESRSFSFTADGETVTANGIPPEIQPLTLRIASLEKECGEPVFEHKEGFESNPFAGAPAPFAAAAPPPFAAQPPGEGSLREGEWFCSNCGYKNASGSFCVECGTPHKF